MTDRPTYCAARPAASPFPPEDRTVAGPDYKPAFDELWGHLKWMHSNKGLRGYLGMNLAAIAVALIDRAYPRLRTEQILEADGDLSNLVEILRAPERQADGVTVWDHTPEEVGLEVMERRAALLTALTPPATQPSATVGVGTAMSAVLNMAVANTAPIEWSDRDWQELADNLSTLHTPPPIATATVVDAGEVREACARIADDHAEPSDAPTEFDKGYERAASRIASAIRRLAIPTPPAERQ